ncbi:hypothetical protein TNIN_104891 [Trichonephila inaurata madagascariensis]|uniref:Uncharacterized protein n=1 Tax=Trichonephila inaurata madagascariensis TaxID=2747483 RepID=A0A8X6XB18_9ARAC|nr:hypothetical protein TNIN_104891 [Trichonephila inaurata madagascariensis]
MVLLEIHLHALFMRNRLERSMDSKKILMLFPYSRTLLFQLFSVSFVDLSEWDCHRTAADSCEFGKFKVFSLSPLFSLSQGLGNKLHSHCSHLDEIYALFCLIIPSDSFC